MPVEMPIPRSWGVGSAQPRRQLAIGRRAHQAGTALTGFYQTAHIRHDDDMGLTVASAKIGERCLQHPGWPAAHRRVGNRRGSPVVPTRSRGRVRRLR
jgi:hypothetical protein